MRNGTIRSKNDSRIEPTEVSHIEQKEVTHYGECQHVKELSFPILFLGSISSASESALQRSTRTRHFVF
jgi:hypothetical protein